MTPQDKKAFFTGVSDRYPERKGGNQGDKPRNAASTVSFMTTTTSPLHLRYPDPGGNRNKEWIRGFWPNDGTGIPFFLAVKDAFLCQSNKTNEGIRIKRKQRTAREPRTT